MAGHRLVNHPDVAKVAFTGSTTVGREVMADAAGTIKRVTLELGGKSASVVFADADIERAAAATPAGVFANAGQDCCARSRALVAAVRVRPLSLLLVGAVEGWPVGDPDRSDHEMGPLVTAGHRRRCRLSGAGHGRSRQWPRGPVHTAGSPSGPGYWFPPTVVAPADPGWRMAREEIFGPVLAVIPFDDEADAVRLANDTPFGLSGSIWTRDSARALRMARAVQSGNLSVNSNSSVRVQTGLRGNEAVGDRPRAGTGGAGCLHRGQERLHLR